jgi:hypothetical protein
LLPGRLIQAEEMPAGGSAPCHLILHRGLQPGLSLDLLPRSAGHWLGPRRQNSRTVG